MPIFDYVFRKILGFRLNVPTYLALYMAFVSPMLLLVAGINYFVDPALLFHPIYKNIAEILLEKDDVIIKRNHRDRLLQQELLKGFEEPHDVVVLGSSRATQLSSELLGESSFFNHSVSAAALEDRIIWRKKNLHSNTPAGQVANKSISHSIF